MGKLGLHGLVHWLQIPASAKTIRMHEGKQHIPFVWTVADLYLRYSAEDGLTFRTARKRATQFVRDIRNGNDEAAREALASGVELQPLPRRDGMPRTQKMLHLSFKQLFELLLLLPGKITNNMRRQAAEVFSQLLTLKKEVGRDFLRVAQERHYLYGIHSILSRDIYIQVQQFSCRYARTSGTVLLVFFVTTRGAWLL